MPLTRINARADLPVLHQQPAPHDLCRAIAQRDPEGCGPIIVMIHGYKYAPGHPHACPHRKILSDRPSVASNWPRNLGFGLMDPSEGLGIAFGWSARGTLHRAKTQSVSAGHALVDLTTRLKRLWPQRPLHVIAHSMGSEVAFEALHHLPAHTIGRLILMTGASFRTRAEAALQTPAGRTAELINITSRENDLFDFLHERLLGSGLWPEPSLGDGLGAPRSVTLQLDCAQTLSHLARLGRPIAPPQRRVCHWSAYARPGTLRLYAALLREPDRFSLARIRAGLPEAAAPRWSRLTSLPGEGLRSAQTLGAMIPAGLIRLSRPPSRARSYTSEAPRSATT